MVRVKRCFLCSTTPAAVSIYKFPQDQAIAAQWATFCRISPEAIRPTSFLCAVHFTADCFRRTFKQTTKGVHLKSGVIPTLYRDGPPADRNSGQMSSNASACEGKSPDDYILQRRRARADPRRFLMGRPIRRTCCICGNVNMRELVLRFYRFPRDAVRRAKWLRSLQLSESELEDWFRVCSRHFVDGKNTGLPVRSLVHEPHPEVIMIESKPDISRLGVERPDLHRSESPPLTVEVESEVILPIMPRSPSVSNELIFDPLGTPYDPGAESYGDERQSSTFPEMETEVTLPNVPHSPSVDNEQLLDPLSTPYVPDSQPTGVENQGRSLTGSTSKLSKRKIPSTQDFGTPELNTTRRKRRRHELGKSQLLKYRANLIVLRSANQRMRKRLIKIEDSLDTLQRKGLISESAFDTLKVHLTGMIGYRLQGMDL